MRLVFFFLITTIGLIPTKYVQADDSERAVVQIVNFSQMPDWTEPWKFSRVYPSAGSGFIIEGNRIMTNAHVVSWSRQLMVFRHQDPKPYQARIEYIGHDCDLAVLKVDDPAFFEGIKALTIGTLPKVRSTVTAYGYPAGGQQISYTRGVISRIESQTYSHIVNRSFLTIQSDAALNPGNSGGPAIQDGSVVGVSFQGNPDLENAGFFIPPEVINHFLTDIEDGVYHGFPDSGLSIVSLHNPAFREYLKLKTDSGARIDRIFHPFPESQKLLKDNDVLLDINGYAVGSDGMIAYEGNRVENSVVFDKFQHGEKVPLKILRDGEVEAIDLPVFVNPEDRISGNQYDQPPPYLIIGGLVFTELSSDYIRAMRRSKRSVHADSFYEIIFRNVKDEATARAKPIVLSSKLNHPDNIDFNISLGGILTELNGLPIQSMQSLKKASENPLGNFHQFKFNQYEPEAIHIEAAKAINDLIMEEYKIPAISRLN